MPPNLGCLNSSRKPTFAAVSTPPARPATQATSEELVLSGMGEREAAAWAEALTFHHQWMVVSREHAASLVALRKDIITVRRAA